MSLPRNTNRFKVAAIKAVAFQEAFIKYHNVAVTAFEDSISKAKAEFLDMYADSELSEDIKATLWKHVERAKVDSLSKTLLEMQEVALDSIQTVLQQTC